MSDLLEWLDAHPGTSLEELALWLGRSPRLLANGWWHAGDVEQAYEELTERLKELGIEPFFWTETANAWLEGKRRVWDTQWKRLLELHADLDLPKNDPRLDRIRALAEPPRTR